MENFTTEITEIVGFTTYRGRAWRRFQQRKHHHKNAHQAKHLRTNFCLEKNWSLMYGRKEKIYRAKKLGFTYPFGRDEMHFYQL